MQHASHEPALVPCTRRDSDVLFPAFCRDKPRQAAPMRSAPDLLGIKPDHLPPVSKKEKAAISKAEKERVKAELKAWKDQMAEEARRDKQLKKEAKKAEKAAKKAAKEAAKKKKK